MVQRRGVAALALAAVLVLGSCGDSDDGDDATATKEVTSSTEADAGGAPDGGCVEAQPLPAGVIEGKPETVELPAAAPADAVVVTVLREGDGPEVTDASYATVHYAGISCFTGEQFDSSWDRGEPITAALGTAAPTATAFNVIPGWTEGLVGQQQGALVQIDIPSDLAYGAQGSPPVIAPDEPLTFVVELLEVSTTPPA
jgi:peptidylprolyl isomerase